MTIYDISLTLSNALPVCQGDLYTVSRLECGVHTGTHLDAPLHFIRDGGGVDTLDLNVLVGPCEVVFVPDAKVIDGQLLESLAIPASATRVVFRTRNSEIWARGEMTFQVEFVAIDQSGAEWLVEHGVRLVVIDYLSVAPFAASIPTHEVLLRAGVIAVEGLNLANLGPGGVQ